MADMSSISAAQSLVRPGEIVTLLWEDEQMRITRAMVCLDRGGKDQQVRTRAREGGRIVRARVLSAGMVKVEP
jgi:flagella basal body P-ring formation protein FlgA